jgi:class 3 adenylate cyclase/predicted ATPase
MRCRSCGTENADDGRFCQGCGEDLAIACGDCGFPNDMGAKFCGGCGLSLQAKEAAKDAPARASGGSERRHLTVMFCDLIASTALSERVDPEELRELLGTYQDTCSRVIEGFGSDIARYIGDGLLVYFGYPQAHEDDARRAVHAGLGVVQALAPLMQRLAERYDHRSGVRIGIHTGLVVAGDIGSGSGEALAIVGETPNLAARLQAMAPPDSVLISADTHALVEGLFVCEDLGERSVKGLSRPIRIYRVQGESDLASNFEVRASRGLTPLVGRDEEIALLRKRWQQAKEGEGEVVLLSGEAGIGKSRIVRGFQDGLAAEPCRQILFYGSSYYANSAFHPLIEQGERWLGFEKDDSVDQRLDKLDRRLARLGLTSPETAFLLASLLSLSAERRYPALELSPPMMKKRTLEALVAVMEAMAHEEPVLIVVEDVHWVDPSTLEFLTLLIDRLQSHRILLLITYRPGFTPPWQAFPHVTAFALNHLSRRESVQMIARLTDGKGLPEEVREQIVAKTDGVPLFVEELTKTVLESGLVAYTGERYTLSGPLPPLAIPVSLQDSLMARLDRLAVVKDLAQLGAVLGRSFSHELLAAVSPLSEAELNKALNQLVQAELIYRRGLPPDVTYEFKHALVQNTAYESLLKSVRQQHHNKIAGVLCSRFPETVANEPELLAYHFTEAGLTVQAIEYWQRAGQRAAERSANHEAIAHLTKGLEQLATLPETRDRARQELAMQIALAGPLIAVKGYGAPEMERTFNRALALCAEIGDTPQIFPVLYGRFAYFQVTGQISEAAGLAEEFLRLAERKGVADLVMVGHRLVGQSLFHLGKPETARGHLEQALASYDPEVHRTLTYLYGMDVRVGALNYLALTLWLLGYPDQAMARIQDSIDTARSLSHGNSVGAAHGFGAILFALCGRWSQVEALVKPMLPLDAEQEFPIWDAAGRAILGWAAVHRGRIHEGIEALETATRMLRDLHVGVFMPLLLAWLADAQGRAGELAQALKTLGDADEMVSRHGDRAFDAELKRNRALLGSAAIGAPAAETAAQAEAALTTALGIARDQGARSLELRAATALAGLWHETGKTHDARELLGPLYAGFDEGLGTADLEAARRLLEELAG